MRCLRPLAVLFALGPLLAQDGPPRIPDPLAPLQAQIEAALAHMHLSVAELGYEKKRRDSWSLAPVVGVLDAPLTLPRTAMGWRMSAQGFGRAPAPRTLLGVGLALGGQPPFGQLWPQPRAEASALEAWRLILGASARDEELPRPVLAGRSAEAWRLLSVAMAQLVLAQRHSWAAPLTGTERTRALDELPQLYMDEIGRTSSAVTRHAALQDALRIELESLALHTLGALGLIERAITELQAADPSELPPPVRAEGVQGDLRFFARTPLGAIAIGGPGATQYEGDLFLVVDVGGDDRYAGRVAGASPLWQMPAAISIDLDGSDRYHGAAPVGQGAGLLGVGLLFDLGADDDDYRGGELCQGAAQLGLGLLFDDGGADRYRAKGFAQGAAAFGFGLLGDAGGDDVFEAERCAQGFAGIRGHAALLDAAGRDVYVGRGRRGMRETLPQAPGSALCQGVAIGDRRLGISGGVALHWDGAGDDHRVSEAYAQGCGYWMGLGVLVDEEGDDTYSCTQYAQGAGVHLAAGLLWDLGGDDRYSAAHGFAQGAGYDLAVGILFDGGGADGYFGAALSQGAGGGNGVGLLLELGGDDVYAGEIFGPTDFGLQGYGAMQRGYGSVGLLLDLEGRDRLSRRAAGEARAALPPARSDAVHGLAHDVGYEGAEPSGAPATPAGPEAPLPVPDPLPAAEEAVFVRLFGIATGAEPGSAPERDRAVRTLAALQPASLRWLLERHGATTSARTIEGLCAVFARAGAAAGPLVRARLADPDPLARRNAAELAACCGDRESVPALRERLDEDAERFVRREAARALGRLGAESALPSFDALVRSDDPADRRAAAEGLAGLPGRAAVHRLADLLGDPSFTVRDPARTALAGRRDEALPLGLQELARGQDPALREWLRLVRVWRAEAARDALRPLTLHADPHVAREAKELLELLDPARAAGSVRGDDGERR